jgi:AcrR family transcriptional regulator
LKGGKMRGRKDGIETRKRILDAACIVFSKKGFRDATIGDICKLAKSNTASVNYHFGDKESLYIETWRQAFQRSIAAHPPDGGIQQDAPAEERLRGQIRSIMQRINDPKSQEFEIMHRELANPTGLLTEVIQKSIDPIREGFMSIIWEMLGEKASEQDVQLCEMSIKAQCFHPMILKRRFKDSPDSHHKTHPVINMDEEAIVNHIMRFSLAGISEIRKAIENRQTATQEQLI